MKHLLEEKDENNLNDIFCMWHSMLENVYLAKAGKSGSCLESHRRVEIWFTAI